MGAGLAGLVAAAELADAGKRVVLLEQEPEASFGGQAWWSFGGLFLVDSPEQRRLRVHDSLELARQDWFGTAAFDRTEDHWPRQWAEAYLQFAAGEKRAWLKEQGVGFFPVVGWAERGGYTATGHGNSVPRFHIVWGTGPGVVAPFARRVRAAVDAGLVELRFRHRVAELVVSGGAVTGVRGAVLEPSDVARGEASSRAEVGDFEISAQAVVVTSGGIGGNHDLVRQELAGPAGPGAAAAALRGARARRRPDAGGDRGRRRQRGQPRPDVALHRGHHQPLPGVGAARHPDPARPLVALAGRDGPTVAGAAVPRLRHPGHAGAHRDDRLRAHLVRGHAQDRREGVRALGLRAEPRPHRQGHEAPAQPGDGRRLRTGAGVPRPRRGLRRGDDAARARRRDEPDHRRHAGAGPRARSRTRSSPATARSRTPSPRTCRSPRSAAPATTSATS